jgi:hypothetical protein
LRSLPSLEKTRPIANAGKLEIAGNDDLGRGDIDHGEGINQDGVQAKDSADYSVIANTGRNLKGTLAGNERGNSDSNSTREGRNIVNGSGILLTVIFLRHESYPTRKKGSSGGGVFGGDSNLHSERGNKFRGHATRANNPDRAMRKDVEGAVSGGKRMAGIETDARRRESRGITRNRREGRDGRTRGDDTTSKGGGGATGVTNNTETGKREAVRKK